MSGTEWEFTDRDQDGAHNLLPLGQDPTGRKSWWELIFHDSFTGHHLPSIRHLFCHRIVLHTTGVPER